MQGNTQKLVEILSRETSSVDIQNSEGLTALMIAAKGGHIFCVRTLLSQNASLDIQDHAG
jgi:ankyrin repeat protein